MRNLSLAILLLFACQFCFGQVFKLDSLPKQGVLLDKGWKWHAGDNPDFDDSAWESIDPTKDIHDLPQIFDSKVKWLRLNIEVKNKIIKPTGISIMQAGASEIYLNGQLIHRIGQINGNIKLIKASDPLDIPLSFPIDTIWKYTLSIRYVLQPKVRYTTLYGLTQNMLFKATIVVYKICIK